MHRMRRASRAGLLSISMFLCGGCTNNPLWRFDRYELRGEMAASTCRVALNGTALPSDTTTAGGRAVLMMIDDAHNVGLPRGQGLKSAGCNGVLLSFASPIDTMPRAGDYKVTRETDYRPGTVTALYSGPRVRVGLWPLAMSAYGKAYDGVVHLDSMDRKHIWARFEFRGRRQHGGE